MTRSISWLPALSSLSHDDSGFPSMLSVFVMILDQWSKSEGQCPGICVKYFLSAGMLCITQGYPGTKMHFTLRIGVNGNGLQWKFFGQADKPKVGMRMTQYLSALKELSMLHVNISIAMSNIDSHPERVKCSIMSSFWWEYIILYCNVK